MARVAWLLVLLGLASPAAARDIFVNNRGGDDRANGADPTPLGLLGPVQSIRKALLVAEAGDRILLANTGVPYREMISLASGRHSGLSSSQPFVIDGGGASLDGSASMPAAAWQSAGGPLFCFRPQRMSYQQLFRNGRPLVRRASLPEDPELPKLEPLEWALIDGWVYFRPENGKLPADYGLTCCSLQTGITLYHVHNVVIANLTVEGFQLDGINAFDGVRDCRLTQVVARGNGRSGVTVAGSSQLEVLDSLVGDNGWAQLYVAGLALAAVRETHLLDNTAPPIVRHGGRVFVDGQPAAGER
ncbi:MAG TPA: right-handed parallel beta-helix repeat-containing protein [Pirellulales bacterium]